LFLSFRNELDANPLSPLRSQRRFAPKTGYASFPNPSKGGTRLQVAVAAFSLVVALTSTKGGTLSDTFGRRGLIIAGWLIYALIYLGFALASARWHIWILYAGYGLYYGAFLGASSALVAELVPPHIRGTAYGIFNAALGVTAFPASLLAGLFWDWYGPSAPFLFGAALALLATIGLVMIPLRR